MNTGAGRTIGGAIDIASEDQLAAANAEEQTAAPVECPGCGYNGDRWEHQCPAKTRFERKVELTAELPVTVMASSAYPRTAAEQRVLDAWGQVAAALPEPDALRADKRISIHAKRLLADMAELARREGK